MRQKWGHATVYVYVRKVEKGVYSLLLPWAATEEAGQEVILNDSLLCWTMYYKYLTDVMQ